MVMVHYTILFIAAVSLGLACMAQVPRTPDVEAQRAAMKKLGFLIGKWVWRSIRSAGSGSIC